MTTPAQDEVVAPPAPPAPPALKPCPFCGDNSAHVHTPPYGDFAVICEGCGAEGALGDTNDAAIAAWNRRALAHRADVARVEWEPMSTLPNCDDEVWLCRGDSFEGPRPPRIDDPDHFDYWCYAVPPRFPDCPTAQPAEASKAGEVVAAMDEFAAWIANDARPGLRPFVLTAVRRLKAPSPSDELRAAVEAAIRIFAKGPPLTPDRNYALEKRYEDYAQLLRDWVAGR